ncbi:amine oxidase [Endogone sp. FLAS-F59071]|nr:amine oxidase [Endogone sp. FLAS-F59071]|eukprot:RUS13595.1 amine oxidase [Endogone sp. FLAS-F59071]
MRFTCLFLLPALAHAAIIRTKVVILGAGMSGIAAAKTLALNHGITDFVIVDGQSVIGGRLHDVPFSGVRVELGANWVQGLGKNPVWTLAKEVGLKVVYSNYSDLIYYNEKGAVDLTEESNEYNDAFTRTQILAGERQSDNRIDISARTGFQLVGWFPDTPGKQAIEYFNFDWELGEPPELSSFIWSVNNYNYTFNGFSPDNDLVIDQRGYKWIPESEAALFLKKDDPRLRLNTIVKKVKYGENYVLVLTDKGDTIFADYAISTFSLGVLQHSDVLFEPPFPSWKTEAIFNFHMATYTKIFLNFDHQFWPDNQYFLYADPTRRGYYPIWQNLNAPGFFPKHTKTNILMVTITDAESKRVELQSDQATQAEIMVVLRSMFGAHIPEPNNIIVPRWRQNPLFRGSYSNWPVGELTEHHDNLRAPVGRLWFAGEACSSDYFGFAHGAWLEGIAAADEIARCFLMRGRCYDRHRPEYPVLNLCAEKAVY